MIRLSTISIRKSKQAAGGDKTPVTPLKPLAAADVPVKFHPIAGIFDLLEGAEFDELVKDISEHGLQLPIIMHEGKILDGRNRYRACLKSGVAPIFNTFSGDDPVAYVISTNVRRRHMTSERKQDALPKLFRLKPKLSARQAAKMVGASPTTASETRKKLVEQGDVSNLDTSVDTKGRRQPRSRKPAKKSKPAETAAMAEEAEEKLARVCEQPKADVLPFAAAGVSRHGSGSGESSTSATNIAKRLVVDLIVHGTMKVDPAKMARLETPAWWFDHAAKIRDWLSAIEAALASREVAS